MSKAAEVKRGRPVKYPVTPAQVRSIIARLGKGQSTATIAQEMEIHPFAVLRVKRQSA